jgi:hypothetical protein
MWRVAGACRPAALTQLLGGGVCLPSGSPAPSAAAAAPGRRGAAEAGAGGGGGGGGGCPRPLLLQPLVEVAAGGGLGHADCSPRSKGDHGRKVVSRHAAAARQRAGPAASERRPAAPPAAPLHGMRARRCPMQGDAACAACASAPPPPPPTHTHPSSPCVGPSWKTAPSWHTMWQRRATSSRKTAAAAPRTPSPCNDASASLRRGEGRGAAA